MITHKIKKRNRLVHIPYDAITYIESCNSKCVLHMRDGTTHNVYRRLSDIQAQLHDRRFLRSHQSYLVNMDYIAFAAKNFTLRNGETVLIRQRDQKQMRNAFYDYCAGKQP